MSEDSLLAFDLPAVGRKKVSVGFDGGLLSSDGGVLVLRGIEKRLGLAKRLGRCLKDRHDPDLIVHTQEEMLRFRMFAIAGGYEDADDCDALRCDPAFKMAIGRAPESGDPLCSQPTMGRLENKPSKIEVARLMRAMVDQFCASYRRAPSSITLDIDDTLDEVHGHQQLSLFNAHYDARCFLPIHIFEASGKPVAAILREGKTPSGEEARTIIKHVIGRIRSHWPRVKILIRGDSHYGRWEVMEWCETHVIDYIFGFASNPVLTRATRQQADELCVKRATEKRAKLRSFAAFCYAAKDWKKERRMVARLEATQKGLDIRNVVTSLKKSPGHLYEEVYCARGQAENFIKMHKAQLASDRTSARDPKANQFRLVLHTAAHWLLFAMRAALNRRSQLAQAEFTTLRLRLLKMAARIVEGASRIRIWLPSAHPDAPTFRRLAGRFCATGPRPTRQPRRNQPIVETSNPKSDRRSPRCLQRDGSAVPRSKISPADALLR